MPAPLARLFPEAAPPGHNEDNGALLDLVLRALPADWLHTATAAGRAMAGAGRALRPEDCEQPSIGYRRALIAGQVPALRWYWVDRPGYLSEPMANATSITATSITTNFMHDRDRSVLAFLASYGRLAALQLAHALGAPWDVYTPAQAARAGHLEVLQWVVAGGCPGADRICSSAASGGHLAVIQWARAQAPPCRWDSSTCSFAAMNGHLAVLQWADANGCPRNDYCCTHAARNGHLAVLQWLRENGCPWNEETCSDAAINGHLPILQWLRAQDPPCPWGHESILNAAGGGHTEVLHWLRANGCPED